LIRVIDEPFAEQTKEIVAKCHLSIEVFKQIDLKVAQRCAEIVARVLNSRQRQQSSRQGSPGKMQYPAKPTSKSTKPESESTRPAFEPMAPAEPSQQASDQVPSKEPQYGLMESGATDFAPGSCPDLTFSGTEWDFSADDELWNELVDSGMHTTRPFESWMNILNDQNGQ
jgi:hypothetical protein